MSIICGSDGSCPFLYSCDTSTNLCSHLPVFPLTLYPLIIYILFPICSALCNLSGNSFGEYKVLMIMDLLNYSENAATTLTYPLITGTGLFNFFTLIPKRHPTKPTSLVDYNIIMVLIPNILYGSTIGALVNNFIPPVAADAILIPILTAFAIKFFLRFRNFHIQVKLQQELDTELGPMKKSERSYTQKSYIQKLDKTELDQKQLKSITSPLQSHREALIQMQKSALQQKKQLSVSDSVSIRAQSARQKKIQQIKANPHYQQLQKHLQYESTFHVPHIVATLVIFAVFQTLAFLAQGKIVQFSICSKYYAIGVSSLTAIYIIFIVCMYFYTSYQMKRYRRIKYDYDGNLDSWKQYTIICLAGFVGGFNGGVFGLGSSTTMIFTLLYMDIEPAVVSATVGFQVFFSGAASLAEAFARNELPYSTAGFFLGQTFIFGGILTLVARWRLQKLNYNKVNQILMLIVGCLCTSSVIALIINIVLGFVTFGSNYMMSIKYDC